jgi:hypothetical protein
MNLPKSNAPGIGANFLALLAGNVAGIEEEFADGIAFQNIHRWGKG